MTFCWLKDFNTLLLLSIALLHCMKLRVIASVAYSINDRCSVSIYITLHVNKFVLKMPKKFIAFRANNIFVRLDTLVLCALCFCSLDDFSLIVLSIVRVTVCRCWYWHWYWYWYWSCCWSDLYLWIIWIYACLCTIQCLTVRFTYYSGKHIKTI